MELNRKEVFQAEKEINSAKRILLISHKSPDGDTIGSTIALYEFLTSLGKFVVPVCTDLVPEPFYFLQHIAEYQQDFALEEFDLVIILDCGAHYMTNFHETHPGLFDKSRSVINIDHHPSNNGFGTINIIQTEACSTTRIIYEMFQMLNWSINRVIATALMTGIFTDTGSFMHSNTQASTLRTAGFLLAKGADLRSIRRYIFKTTPLSTLQLWGRVLKNIHINESGITMTVLNQKDFEETNADYSELSGVIDYVNSVPGSDFSVMLTERDGSVKGSLRTLKDDIDVAAIAGEFGGGGHKKAAGFTIPGRLEKEIRWRVVEG